MATPAANNPQAFTGVYVDLDELLALRFSANQRKQRLHTANASQNGARLSKLRGRGVDFAEVRGYQPGDDIRTIDWRVTARKNAPHTKVFREERERPTLIIVDQTQTMFFGSQRRLKSVAAAQAAAIAAWHALADNDRVGGFVMNNDQGNLFPPKHSAAAVARLISRIAHDNQQLNRHSMPVDGLPLTQQLEQHNEVNALRIYDPLEQELPANDIYSVTNGATTHRFDAANPRLRQHYRQKFDEYEQQLRLQLTRSGIRYASLATGSEAMQTQDWL